MSGIMPYAGLISFLRAPVKQDAPPHVVVMGLPTDFGTSHRPGARLGPRAIREASLQYAYDPSVEGLYDIELGKLVLKGVRIEDRGDVSLEPGDAVKRHGQIVAAASRIFKEGSFPVFLGGDHSVTYPILEGLGDPEVVLLHLDAHADLDSTFDSPLTHGSVMRRIHEEGLCAGIVQVGLRGLLSDQGDVYDARDAGIRQFTAREVEDAGLTPVLEVIPKGRPLYLSLDIDVFDPSIAPGTGTPEPGGLTYRQVTSLIREAAAMAPIIGMDVVEVSPPYDAGGITALLAARVIIDTLGCLNLGD